jgi:hypothetical protein
MDLIPVAGNAAEIVMLSAGYVWASIDIGRRLSWTWAENAKPFSPTSGYEFGAWCTAFFAMPAALAMVHANTNGGGWDKPPRSTRREAKHAEQRKAYEALEEENRRMEKRLELYEASS